MMFADPLSTLRQHQRGLLETVRCCPADDISRQFHPDLSPLGWHLGHCVFTESYWLREVVIGLEKISDEQKGLYIPELSVKALRGAALPPHEQLCAWAAQTQEQNLAYFAELLAARSTAPLMQDSYLLFFLCQHYAQHIETAKYVLTQRHLKTEAAFKVSVPLTAAALRQDYHALPSGTYRIGAGDRLRHYDNECPGFCVELPAYQIGKTAISNAEFLGFMTAGGYRTAKYWSEAAWQWCRDNNITRPQHWRRDQAGHYYGTDAQGPFALEADKPVSGLSLHEANAVATWARARLPHEYEWESAKKTGLLEDSAQVWEWCHNPFHPYPGFAAFPYEGYSLPWFDQLHFSLRGGSPCTLPIIQRASFRNFYQPDKRHFPAGLRLASP